MALFEWKDQYSVKVKDIDKQHKMLVATLNELHVAMLNRSSKEILSGIIKGLVEYTAVHFSFEEGKMNMFNYPDFIPHKKEHDEFTRKVKDFQERYRAGTMMLSLEIMRFLRDWLQDHIQVTDMKYSAFFDERGLT